MDDLDAFLDAAPAGGDDVDAFLDAPRDWTLGDIATNAGETAKQFAHGFNETLADIVSAPARLGHAITDPVLQAVDFGGAPREQGPVERFLRSGPEPQGKLGRIARRAGAEVMTAVPLAAVPFAAALRPAGQMASTLGGRVVQGMVDTVRAAPGTAAVLEGASAAGAGIGAGIANEISPGSTTAEIIGQTVGGLAPAAAGYTPVVMAARGARNVWGRISPQAQTEAARREAAKVVGGEMRPDAVAEAEELRQAIPGFNPTLAEATGSPALVATQKRLEKKASGPELEQMMARRAGSEQAVERFAQEAAPGGPDGPEIVIDTARQRVESLSRGIESARNDVAAIEQRWGAGVPRTDRSATGSFLRDKLLDLRSQTSARMSRLATELGLDDVDVTVPFGKARDELLAEFAPKSVFDDVDNVPEVLSAIRKVTADTPMPQTDASGAITGFRMDSRVTFGDLKALRERVSDDLMDAQSAANPSRKKIRALAILKERVDGLIDTLTETADPTLAARYKQFRDTYRTEYIERFEKGPAFKVRQKDGRGFYRVADEKVADAFFAPSDVSSARQFKAVYGNDPEANAALEAVALDSLRDAAVRDGRIVPNLLQAWERRHASVLDEFPSLRAAVTRLENVTERLAARQAQLTERARWVEDALLSRELAKIERGGPPDALIDAAVRDPRRMGQLLGSLRKNEEALTALRRNVWNMAADGSAEEIADFVNRFQPSLRLLFSPQHLGNLRRIQRARAMLQRTPAPSGQGYQPNPLAAVEGGIGMGVPQLASRVFAVESGRTSARYVTTDALGRFLRGRSQAASEALLKEALYDPEVAKDLAAVAFDRAGKADVSRRLNARLFSLGLVDSGEEPSQ